jgi:hypothetical protein
LRRREIALLSSSFETDPGMRMIRKNVQRLSLATSAKRVCAKIMREEQLQLR